jgi:hypothetical protein
MINGREKIFDKCQYRTSLLACIIVKYFEPMIGANLMYLFTKAGMITGKRDKKYAT